VNFRLGSGLSQESLGQNNLPRESRVKRLTLPRYRRQLWVNLYRYGRALRLLVLACSAV